LPSRPSNATRAAKTSAPVFAALGDETRLRLVSRLCEQGPLSIAKLTAGTDVTRQAITKHLHVLAEAGLVHGTRDGRENVWQLETRRLQVASDFLGLISKQWDDALGRLKTFVEDQSVAPRVSPLPRGSSEATASDRRLRPRA
jgi:DNA-binding transcriptional ArsR family regulator